MTADKMPAEQAPIDPQTGLMLPLRTFLGLQELARHRAMVAVELEVMAKKLDRFGWDRDKGTAVHDRIMLDWMDALQDYTLAEVRQACREWIRQHPRTMPNEGDIRRLLLKARAAMLSRQPAPPEPESKRVDPETAGRIVAELGFAVKKFGDGEKNA